MITLDDYWMGRDLKYRADLTPEIIANAQVTVDRVNQLIEAYRDCTGVELSEVASGWRPPAVNEATSNAAKASTHLAGQGCDLRDNANRDFARWCLQNEDLLAEIGLWMEDPRHTWRAPDGRPWVHLQIRPPRSARRVFIANAGPATAPLLVEQGGVA